MMKLVTLTTIPSESFPQGVTIILPKGIRPKDGKRPSKYANKKQSKFRLAPAVTYHQNKERTKQEAAARAAQGV